jgi:hypothetical protein
VRRQGSNRVPLGRWAGFVAVWEFRVGPPNPGEPAQKARSDENDEGQGISQADV